MSILALLLAALGAGASPPAPVTSPAPAPGRVLVVGDSLAVGMKPYLTHELRPHRVVWNALAGQTTPWGLRKLQTTLRWYRPQAVVVSLGTNDGPSGTAFARRIDTALDHIPRSACVIWPDVYRPSRKGPFRALNSALDRAALTHRRLHVVPWREVVARNHVRLADGLHPDANGYHYRSALIARAVRRDCRL